MHYCIVCKASWFGYLRESCCFAGPNSCNCSYVDGSCEYTRCVRGNPTNVFLKKHEGSNIKLAKGCLHCIKPNPTLVRRPIGETHVSEFRNQNFHMDYFYVSETLYLLLMKDGFTSKHGLFSCKEPDSYIAARRICSEADMVWMKIPLIKDLLRPRKRHFR
jgi:hypothetical protein